MKPLRISSLSSVLLLLTLSITGLRAEDWTTLDGKTYKGVKVVKVEDDAVTILYQDGGALIRFFRLPPELQARFHYDPEKSHAADAARTQSDNDNRAALSQERAQAAKLRAAQAAKDAAEQAAAHAALEARNAPQPDALPVAQFSNLGPTHDATHHTIGEFSSQVSLDPHDPNQRTTHQALSTNDPDMPVAPR